MNDMLREKLKSLKDDPGVYIMKDASGGIIYIGKAVSLKNRVRQYFQSSKNHAPKVIAMVSHIEDFDYIITDTESEALTLESNLIKQHKPRYNILLKDDKHFPYVRIDMKADYPRLEVIRKVKNDGAKYIGPYLSSYSLNESIEAVRNTFPLRSCKKDIAKAIARNERPCLNFHIGKCVAPCSGNVTKEKYREIIDDVVSFLSGKTDNVILKMKNEMHAASENMEYETAAVLRDKIAAIEAISEKQKAIVAGLDERDVFALVADGSSYVVYALFIRAGKLCGTERFEMQSSGELPSAVMESFLKQYYTSAGYVPKEVVIRDNIAETNELVKWLSGVRGSKVTLISPQKGDKKKLADMAYKNGIEYMQRAVEQKRKDWERHEGALKALTTGLGMEQTPCRIEAYDISHIQGTDSVGSMIVFENGRPASKNYRRFKIKTVEGSNDIASLKEIISRRLKRSRLGDNETAGFAELPDLMIIDGGKAQLNAALDAMNEMGARIPVVGLAERLEEVFLPAESIPVLFETGSPALFLLQSIRDEAHRFAITYHRSLHSKNALMSLLDGINGIGAKRKRYLFETFYSIDEMKAATLDQIMGVKGMDKNSAQSVYNFLQGTQN